MIVALILGTVHVESWQMYTISPVGVWGRGGGVPLR